MAAAGVLALAALASLMWASPEPPPHAQAGAPGTPDSLAFSQYDPSVNLLALDRPPEAPREALGEGQILSRMSRLYRYQADLYEAKALGNEQRIGRVLDQAMREMQALARKPGLWQRPRFQRLYGILGSEYRDYYGTPDTLFAARGNVFSVRQDFFAAVETVPADSADPAAQPGAGLSDAPLLGGVSPEEIRPQETDVALPLNRLTRAGLRYLQRAPRKHVYRWMRRQETYFPMIEHIFAEENVPDELKYLAMVESGLNTQAKSWANAAGIWQFIPATARAYGLKITPWVDERLDPEKATRAAARHLKDLHRLFGGDWHLALAGYNCSPTRIRRAMRKARRQGRTPTFWTIYPYIPRETRNYVPTYVATALMLSDPQAFDLKRVSPGPRYRFDRIPVRGMLPLETVARLAGTSVEKIRALNPSLRKDTLPPSAQPFYVRLPYGSYARFEEAYRALPDAEKALTLTHRVRAGETLGGMAARYDVPMRAIQKANGLHGTTLTAGDSLVVPVASYDDAEALLASDAAPGELRPERVRYSTRTLRPLAVTGDERLPGRKQAQAGGGAISQDVTTYRVRRGDTLYGIARRHDVSVAQLRRWNDLHTKNLQPGQKLTVRS